MKTLKGNFGTCYFVDCMNPEIGLPHLEDKSWNCTIIDPPYNIDAKVAQGRHFNHKREKDVMIYSDLQDTVKYYEWCNTWFQQLKRISQYGYIFCGFTNIGYWTWEQKCGYLIWHRVNSGNRGFNAFFNTQEPLITFGTPNRKPMNDIIKIDIVNGFMSDEKWIHPHPKPRKLIKYLLEGTRAINVLDPMIGSGTTAEIAEEMGIKWLGFELEEQYAPDIEKRIKIGIGKHKMYKHQRTLI